MHLLTLQPPGDANPRISGEVTVHASALLAPGTVLLADPGSRIVVGAGVCIGMGVVLHAHGGTLHLEHGVNLGAGVLIAGEGLLGAQSCVGSAATLINPRLARGQIVPPGSLLGDTDSSPAASVQAEPVPPSTEPSPPLDIPTMPRGVIGEVYLSQLRMTLFPHHQNLNPSSSNSSGET
ncbi:LbetaH domain-containing protein [Anthocerotibacter panamensis]|uniref:hypothetical protein n=1 Tax=Anthocerotibacter panamensis TaxID=2857077 RepID=UPI001C4038B2|nr:hypothetical protein [Anthocerotibacter panamensis]